MTSPAPVQPVTLADFIERQQITSTAVRIPARPDARPNDAADAQWDHTARHWIVTLKREGFGPVALLAVCFSQGSAYTKAPTAADVLASLAMDAQSAGEGFEEWAGNCGFDTDSRRAEAIFNECVRIRARLAAFFGTDAAGRKAFAQLTTGAVEIDA